MSLFKGVATALITPFHSNDKVDYDALKSLVNFQLENGVDALIVNGTTGEPTTMTHFERTLVAETVIQEVAGRVPVILGAGSNNTYTAVEYAREAEDLGANGILAVTPYYNKCTQAGIIAHYTAIAKCVKLPVIMYNVPGRTGVNINPETALELSAVDNIVALKEASGNMNQFMECSRLLNGKLDIYSGDDGLTYPLLALGAVGVISVASNILPAYMGDIVKSYLSGDIKKSYDLQMKINPLIKALFAEVNPIPVKCAAKLMGIIPDDYMRLPLTKFSKENYLIDELTKFGVKL